MGGSCSVCVIGVGELYAFCKWGCFDGCTGVWSGLCVCVEWGAGVQAVWVWGGRVLGVLKVGSAWRGVLGVHSVKRGN